jgi:hypothetical protein
MNKYRLLKGIKVALFIAAVIALLGWVVMSLWNWLLPGLLGIKAISFAQALGVLILSRILFGGLRGPGFGGGFGPGRWRRRMQERWQQMTPEEREKLRAGLRGRCGPWRENP